MHHGDHHAPGPRTPSTACPPPAPAPLPPCPVPRAPQGPPSRRAGVGPVRAKAAVWATWGAGGAADGELTACLCRFRLVLGGGSLPAPPRRRQLAAAAFPAGRRSQPRPQAVHHPCGPVHMTRSAGAYAEDPGGVPASGFSPTSVRHPHRALWAGGPSAQGLSPHPSCAPCVASPSLVGVRLGPAPRPKLPARPFAIIAKPSSPRRSSGAASRGTGRAERHRAVGSTPVPGDGYGLNVKSSHSHGPPFPVDRGARQRPPPPPQDSDPVGRALWT